MTPPDEPKLYSAILCHNHSISYVLRHALDWKWYHQLRDWPIFHNQVQLIIFAGIWTPSHNMFIAGCFNNNMSNVQYTTACKVGMSFLMCTVNLITVTEWWCLMPYFNVSLRFMQDCCCQHVLLHGLRLCQRHRQLDEINACHRTVTVSTITTDRRLSCGLGVMRHLYLNTNQVIMTHTRRMISQLFAGFCQLCHICCAVLEATLQTSAATWTEIWQCFALRPPIMWWWHQPNCQPSGVTVSGSWYSH